MRLRPAELIAALSLATDLGLGLPQEHGRWAWYLPGWADRALPDLRFGHA
jgi:hypothetical protein